MLRFEPFQLERYFARYEFKARYLLSASDCESLSLAELLELADPPTRTLWETLSLGYTESQGHPELRREIARLYETVSADDLLVLTPEEGIFIALQTLLEPGDQVVALTPAYQSLSEVARAGGCEVTLWPLTPEDDRWRLDLHRLVSALTPRARLLVLNFPNNPTGFLPTREQFDAIVGVARSRDLYIFSDEMYRWLEPDPARRLPALCDVYEKGITLSGLSKSFALPGLRLGWLAAREPGLVERWLAFKDYTTICHSAPSEVLALMALRARQTILTRNLKIIQSNLAHMEAFCADHPQLFHWLRPDAGSVAFPAWIGPGSVNGLAQALVDGHGVMLAAGSLFNAAPAHSERGQAGGGHFRVGLGRRNFPEALSQVRAYLRAARLT